MKTLARTLAQTLARGALCALWALCLLSGTTAARAQISEEAAEKLLRASGQWAQLEVVGPQFRTGLEQGLKAPGTEVPDDVRNRMIAAAEAAFQVDRLRASMRRTLSEGVRAPLLPELLAWYDSPVGRQVTATEENDTRQRDSPEARAKAGVAVLQAATPERRQLLLRLVETSRAGQAAADTVAQMMLGVQASLARFEPARPRPPESELRAALDAQRPQMTRAMEGLTLALFAYTYRDLPDEPVAAYTAFMGSAAGDHYNDLTTRAFENALQEALAAIKP